MDNAIFHINVLIKFFPSSKHLVKDIEETTMVFVQILYVLGVVYLVHGMGVHEFFQKTQFWNIDRV